MNTEILIIAEHSNGELDPITSDLMAWGAQIGAAKGWKTGVLVAGAGLDPVVAALRSSGVDALHVLDDPALAVYNAGTYVEAIAALLAKAPQRLVLVGHTYLGIEMSGAIAARLDATLWSNCRSIAASDHGYQVTRPISRGAYTSALEVDGAGLTLITLQRGTALPVRPSRPGSPQIISLDMPSGLPVSPIRVTGQTSAELGTDITKADILVAVGRGIGEQEHLREYQDLADILGGSIASSRPLVDMGWLPVDYQVGLSGRTVQPRVYLACGISGSMQHLAGMRSSKVIIAINEDPNAPIFEVAHYGIVGDINAILPELTQAAKLGANAR
jgi:electron transfer flavoprotein alpha subunit